MNFVFDLYGTLVDIKTDESKPVFWQKVAEYLGDGAENAESVRSEYLSLCAGEKKGEFHEINLAIVFEKMLINRGKNADGAPAFAGKFRELSREKLKCFRYAKSILKGLKELGCGVYLVSNAQACFTLTELDKCGLTELFDGILISSEVGVKKPCRDIFEIAFKKFGISKENSIYVGNDLRDDILGASGADMRSAYIHTEQSGSYGDDMPTPTYTARNHSELMKRLFSLAKEG